MKLFISFASLLLVLPLASGQFTCTFSATDEDSCLSQTDDSGSYCVWCAMSGFGFCVAEDQAEAMEQAIPSIDCDRNTPANDDDATPPDTDDAVAPTDDALPDNYWKCLQQKDAATCADVEDCTWCTTKAGFGLCMTGPTAEAAADSDWFQCQPEDAPLLAAEDVVSDPYDTACALAYLQDPTEEGCKAAVDADGNPCEWCDLQGMTNLCLNEEQAEAAEAIGVTCEEGATNQQALLRGA